MAISQQEREQFEQNRLQMSLLEKRFRLYLWCSLGLGASVFLSAFMAGALSTLERDQHSAGIFYNAMSAGVFQILLGLVTIVCGWITSGKKRAPSLILLGIYLISCIMIFLQKNGTFSAANLVFLIIGIALNIWVQSLLNQHDQLKEQPGYPHFNPEASKPAEYELPLDIRVRRQQAAKAMDTLGTPAVSAPLTKPVAPAAPVTAPQPAVERDENGFSNPKPLGPTPSVRLSQMASGAVLQKPAQTPAVSLPEPPKVELETLTLQQPKAEEALPQVNAADMLADMIAIPSHATTQGNPEMLPSPEEVRARMAAMKRARQEHPLE